MFQVTQNCHTELEHTYTSVFQWQKNLQDARQILLTPLSMRYQLPSFQVAQTASEENYNRTFVWPKLAEQALKTLSFSEAIKVLEEAGAPYDEAKKAVVAKLDESIIQQLEFDFKKGQ